MFTSFIMINKLNLPSIILDYILFEKNKFIKLIEYLLFI